MEKMCSDENVFYKNYSSWVSLIESYKIIHTYCWRFLDHRISTSTTFFAGQTGCFCIKFVRSSWFKSSIASSSNTASASLANLFRITSRRSGASYFVEFRRYVRRLVASKRYFKNFVTRSSSSSSWNSRPATLTFHASSIELFENREP